jgi:hypothetical protein
MDYFIEYQRKDFHMLKLKTTTHAIQVLSNNTPNVFSVKAVENGEDATEIEVPFKAG